MARSRLLWTVLCRRVLGCLHFLPFFCLFICLLVCFPCVLSWMKCLVFLYSARRHGGLKAKRILHCLSATLICCFSLAIYSFYCFGRLNSPPPTPPPLSHTCLSLTPSFSLSVIWQLQYFLSPRPEKQDDRVSVSGRIETKQIHTRRMEIFPVLPPPSVTPVV